MQQNTNTPSPALSANTLAKVHPPPPHLPPSEPLLTTPQIVNGMSDNLLCSVIRAWDTDSNIDGKKKIIAVAPAMNSVTTPPAPSHSM